MAHKPINSTRGTRRRSDAFPKDAGEKNPAVLVLRGSWLVPWKVGGGRKLVENSLRVGGARRGTRQDNTSQAQRGRGEMEEEGNREDEDEDGQSRGGRGLRWQDWSDQGISPDEKKPTLGTRHREPANKGVVEAAGRSLWRGRLSEPSSRPKFQFCWGYGGVRIPASTFFFNQQWMEGSSTSLHNPAYLSAHLNCREEERHPPTRGCARQL